MKSRLIVLISALAVIMWAGLGCDSDNESDAFIGTWAIYDQTHGAAPNAWYVHFRTDNKYFFSKNKDGSHSSPIETYDVSDNKLTGKFTNPNAGKGRIEAIIKNGAINMNFIEYWHTPYKVVKYIGHKV